VNRLAALLVAASALSTAAIAAPSGTPKSTPTIVRMADAPVRVAGHGKARIALLARGEQAFIGRLELDPGAKVPAHRDPTEEFIHMVSGSGVVTIDGLAREVGPGDTIYMPAGAEVSYVNGPERLVAIQVFADPQPADRYQGWAPVEAKPAGASPAP